MTGDTAGTPRKRAARQKADAEATPTRASIKPRPSKRATSATATESSPRTVKAPVQPDDGWSVEQEPAGTPAAQPELAPGVDEADEGPTPAPVAAHLATPDELIDWDDRAVAGPNGHVLQSRAWAEYRAAHGWQAWHLAFDDGFRMLVLGQPRSAGGRSAYGSRGPIPEVDPRLTAMRAAEAARLLDAEGATALTVDGETPASTGLGRLLKASGFEPTEELQPSRHRMDVRLGPDDLPNSDEGTIFASFGATTRNLIRQAERHDLRVKRLDAGGGRADGAPGTGTLEDFESVDLDDRAVTDKMLRMFYSMLDATAGRRGFALASEDRFLDWSKRAIPAGHLLYLQAEHPQDGPVAGATFYRHGHRLTYSLAGDRAELRRNYPGAVRLLVWRGIQIALDERRTSVDLGGVDTAGARGKPSKGDPTYGMYQFKESFGARWVEMAGAHRRTMGTSVPMRSLARRVLGKIAALPW